MDSRATIVDVSTLFSCLTVYQKSGPMKIPLKPAHLLLTVIAVLGIEGCAAHTPYRETPVVSLSDEQLIQELASAVQGMGIAINRAQLSTSAECSYGGHRQSNSFRNSSRHTLIFRHAVLWLLLSRPGPQLRATRMDGKPSKGPEALSRVCSRGLVSLGPGTGCSHKGRRQTVGKSWRLLNS